MSAFVSVKPLDTFDKMWAGTVSFHLLPSENITACWIYYILYINGTEMTSNQLEND